MKSSIIIMLKSNFEFEVLVNGRGVKEYYHKGSNYIEAKEGSRFSLKMRNNSGHRVLFVPTVDGLSIMSGKEASFSSRGYVVGAYDSLTIDGWRTSDDKVAEFFFSSPKGSYATKMDKEGNLGVIGCAVFKEKVKEPEVIIKKEYIPMPYPSYPSYPHWHSWPNTIPCYCGNGTAGITSTSTNTMGNLSYGGGTGILGTPTTSNNAIYNVSSTSNASNHSYFAQQVSSGLGTGFGEDKYSPVTTVSFDKEETPTAIFTILYNTKENLETMGVEFKKPVYVAPSAFPNEDGYCARPN